MPSPGLAVLIAGIVALSLNAYVLLAGADFGGGVWDLLATGPRRERQRAAIAHAIGPIWEANHVWLVLVIVLLFTCFPPVFAALGTLLHIPLTLMLVGIIARGSAFVFRSYGPERGAEERRWGRVFAVASVVTPLLLGVCVGALAAGRVGDALGAVGMQGAGALGGARIAEPGRPGFLAVFVRPWLSPFTVATGLFTLALFAFLAAVYLTVEVEGERDLQEDFRRRALGAAAAVFVCAFGALALGRREGAHVAPALTAAPWALPLHVAIGGVAVLAIGALLTRRYRLARIAAAAQVTAILWGWVGGQYPFFVPPALTIADTASPATTLRLVLITLAVGALVLIPSLVYLFRLFKWSPAPPAPGGPRDSA